MPLVGSAPQLTNHVPVGSWNEIKRPTILKVEKSN